MPLQRVPINNFRGGLNTRDGPFDLQPNESPDLLNVTITALVGQLKMRDGSARFDAGGMPAATADNMTQVVLNNNYSLMCSIGGSVYSSDAGGNLTLRFAGTVNSVWAFAQMKDAANVDHVWMVNGVDTAQKWDGATSSTVAWVGGGGYAGFSVLRVWRNRMCLAGPMHAPTSRLFLSPYGDPEQTTAGYDFLDLRGPDDESDSITELNELADRLYVFKNRSVWVIADPSTLANRRLGEPGCSARFQSDVIEDKLYFFNEQGLWSTGGVAIALETGSITNYFPNKMNYAHIDKVRVLGTNDSYPRVLVAIPTGTSTSNNVLIELVPHINFRRIGGRRYLLLPAFMLHTLPVASLANFKINGSWQILAGGNDAHRIRRLFVPGVLTDDGVLYGAHWASSWMAIQGEEPFERIRRLNVELQGDAIVDVLKDFNDTPDFSSTLPDPSPPTDVIWDNPPHTWDEKGPWDSPLSAYRFARVRPESRGRFHQIRFRNLPGGQPFLINVAELAIRGGKEH